MLSDATRSALYRLSIAMCAISAMLLPLAARSSLAIADRVSSIALPPLAVTKIDARPKPLIFERDPFQPTEGAPISVVARVVRGVVLGSNPQALLDDGGRERLVEVGTAVAGSRVIAIVESGVILENGTELRLAGDSH